MSCVRCAVAMLGTHPVTCSKSQDDISYQLLLGTSASSIGTDRFPLCTDDEERESHTREALINFYLEDGTQQQLIVEENLRSLDLCHLLALKVNVPRSYSWTLVERLHDLGIERIIEDHEDALLIYIEWKRMCPLNNGNNMFIFRQDFRKYEFFHCPQFFPLNMVDLGAQLDCLSESVEMAKVVTLQNMLNSGEKTPTVQGHMWCKEPDAHSWKRLFFRIEGRTLYILQPDSKDPCYMQPFIDLQYWDIFTPVEGRCRNGPTMFSLCLKSSNKAKVMGSGIVWLCSDSEQQLQCWVVALRLAKYGKKLQENFKEVRERYGDCSSYVQVKNGHTDQVPSDYTPMKPRVAMDFTGQQGRIVDDPKEVQAIAAAEAHNWKRKLSSCRGQTPPHGSSQKPAFEFGIHTTQPWFYGGMLREEASQLLMKYGTVDGVFLVRESHSKPGSFVLSYVYCHKIHHSQIMPVEEKAQLCYSLDSGRTKFYDLLQLVEFYQLNLGGLPTKLTHFLVHQPKRLEQS